MQPKLAKYPETNLCSEIETLNRKLMLSNIEESEEIRLEIRKKLEQYRVLRGITTNHFYQGHSKRGAF